MLFFLFTLTGCQQEEKKVIVCWGDSLTAPHGGKDMKGVIKKLIKGKSYPTLLQSYLGEDYQIINAGIGGENTLTIMARQGAYPMRLSHDIILFPDENAQYEKFIGNSEIDAFYSSYNQKRVTPLLQLGWKENGPAQINPCHINGKEFQLYSEAHFWKENNKYHSEWNYYIKNKFPIYSSDTLKAGSIIETYAMRHLRNTYANIFFMGQNGGFKDTDDLIRQFQAMIDYSQCNRFIIISFHKPNQPIPNVQRMQEMEDSLQHYFGQHYINLRKYLIQSGLKDAGLTPTKIDSDSIRHNQVPPQLMTDGCHFTSKGYELLARLVEKRFRELGY